MNKILYNDMYAMDKRLTRALDYYDYIMQNPHHRISVKTLSKAKAKIWEIYSELNDYPIPGNRQDKQNFMVLFNQANNMLTMITRELQSFENSILEY